MVPKRGRVGAMEPGAGFKPCVVVGLTEEKHSKSEEQICVFVIST